MKRTEGKAQVGRGSLSQVKAKVPVAYEVELRRMVELVKRWFYKRVGL